MNTVIRQEKKYLIGIEDMYKLTNKYDNHIFVYNNNSGKYDKTRRCKNMASRNK